MLNPNHLIEKKADKFSSIGVLGVLSGSLEEEVKKYHRKRPALIFAEPKRQRSEAVERIFIAGCLKNLPLSITLVQYVGLSNSSITAYGIGDRVKSELVVLGEAIGLISVEPIQPSIETFMMDAKKQEEVYQLVCSAVSSEEEASREEEIARLVGMIYREQLSSQYGYPRE